jgi:hypothetical protein
MGSRVSQDGAEWRHFSFFRRESNPGHPARCPSLYWLSYSGSFRWEPDFLILLLYQPCTFKVSTEQKNSYFSYIYSLFNDVCSSDYTVSNGGMITGSYIRTDVVAHFKLHSRHSSRQTEGKHKIPQSEQRVSWPKFETGTSRIQFTREGVWGSEGIVLHILDLAVHGGEWSDSRPCRFNPREDPPVSI